jgi:RHS repeat-associated protein
MKERRFDPVPYLSFDARWSVSFWAALTWLLATVSLQAQNPTPPAMSPLGGTTPSINEPGAPEASYRLSSIEHLNYANGHLNISIPLVDIPGRGGAKETLILPIESHWWVMSQPYRYGNNQSSVGFSYLPYNTPWNSDEPTFWGGILLLRNGGDFCYVLSGSPPDAWQNTLTRLTFIAPDGTEHELRDVNTDGQKQGKNTGQLSLTASYNRGTVFQAYDGSDAVFTSTSPIGDPPRGNCGGASPSPAPNGNGTLQLRDGTTYTIAYGYVTQIEDRNGNLLALPSPVTGTYPLQINDALGRTTSISAPGSTQTITYPGYNGQLETVTIAYNSLDQLTNGLPTQTYGALFPAIDAANNCQPNSSGCEGGTDNSTMYDPPGMVQSVQYPNGQSYSFTYDVYGNVVEVKLPNGGWHTASTAYAGSLVYFPNGAIDNLKLSPNLLIQQQCQNSRLQVTNVRLARAGVGTTGSCVNGGSGTAGDWLNLGFGFATGGTNNGNIISSAIATSQPLSLTQTFTYDAYNRIATAVEAGSPGWTRNYNYDAYGNGWVSYNSGLTLSPFTATGTTTSSSNFASNNQLSIANSAYDLAGNQTTIGGYTFTYDGENRQATAKLNGVTTTYTYDGEGRRVQKATSGGATTVYVYDAGGQLAAEYSSNPPSQSATLYLTDDPLGSTRLVSNAGGSPVGYDDYLPFGEEIPSGTDGRGSLYYATDGVTQKFTGKERDAELAGSAMQGLDFFLTRYSSGAQGRFTSPDKFPWWSYQHAEKDEDKETFKDFMANPQNWNMYAYVLNNPLNHTDPTGMLGCQVGDQKYASCTITVVYDRKTSEGTLTVTGQNKGDKKATVLLTASVVVGGDGHITPTGDYHAGKWTKDYTTQTYGWKANTKWSESPLGLNAFGPYQLHIKELEDRGIWIHGTMGPGWSGTTKVSGIAVSETSHGCVRMCNRDDIQLFKMMPNPVGNPIKISTNPNDFPGH